MSIILITAILFGGFFLAIFLGLPIAWSMGGVSVFAAIFLWGPQSMSIAAFSVWDQWTNTTLMCIPLFVLMASLLQHSGIADELFEVMYKWIGGVRGGLAIGTMAVCTIFAAISGLGMAALFTMGLIALPAMLKRGYSKHISVGTILVGSSLGMLIPPSIIMIIYAFVSRESVGMLWFGGMLPGLMVSAMFMTYIAIRCHRNPKLGPPVPLESRVSFREKLISLRKLAPPVGVIALILGTIYTGVCTPTEAAVIGVAGMIVVLLARRELTRKVLKDSLYPTFTITAMCFWILLAISCFDSVYVGLGARELIQGMVLGWNVSPFTIIVLMMGFIFAAGMVMDDFVIMLICAPIFVPIVRDLGFDTLWYGILFVMNIQAAYCTPPFGWTLFLGRAIMKRQGVTMADMYRSVIPFNAIQVGALLLVLFFPQIATTLPRMMMVK